MVYYNHTHSSGGGDGCIVYLHSLILSKEFWVKVKSILIFWWYLIVSRVAIGHQEINCAEKELSKLEPPSGVSCGTYLASYISNKGGYLTNPAATSACEYCSSRTTDEFYGPTFNISYSHHWRDLGIFCAYIVFNVGVSLVSYMMYELMSCHRWLPCTSSHTFSGYVQALRSHFSGNV